MIQLHPLVYLERRHSVIRRQSQAGSHTSPCKGVTNRQRNKQLLVHYRTEVAYFYMNHIYKLKKCKIFSDLVIIMALFFCHYDVRFDDSNKIIFNSYKMDV